jgi:hypothetical protein
MSRSRESETIGEPAGTSTAYGISHIESHAAVDARLMTRKTLRKQPLSHFCNRQTEGN